MKKIICILVVTIFIPHRAALALACKDSQTLYTACKAGYYLASDKTDCIKCPDGSTSDDKNYSGISACYLPVNDGTEKAYEDNTGSFITTGICYHK